MLHRSVVLHSRGTGCHVDLRGDAQPVFEQLDDFGPWDVLGDRRQIVERVEAQLLEERVGRPEQDRLARTVVAPISSMYPRACNVRMTPSGSTPRIAPTWACEIGCL